MPKNCYISYTGRIWKLFISYLYTLNTHQSNLWPSDSIVSVKEAKYIWLARSSPGTSSSRRSTPRHRLKSYPIWGSDGPTDCFYERGLSVSFAYVWLSRRTIITCISLPHWSLQFIWSVIKNFMMQKESIYILSYMIIYCITQIAMKTMHERTLSRK